MSNEQQSQRYQMPPDEIAALADAKPTPIVHVDPTGERMVVMHYSALLDIVDLSRPELRLGGLRIDPDTWGQSRTTYYRSLAIREIRGGSGTAVKGLPDAARIRSVRWSPDGAFIVFTLTGEDAIQLWIADTRNGEARRLSTLRLNGCVGSPFHWLPDSSGLVLRAAPEPRPDPPTSSPVPEGPVVQENLGRTAPAWTYQDLLKSPHDVALFRHYMTSNVTLVDIDGKARQVGPPDLIARAEPSPGGDHLLVQTFQEPFSYLVPYQRFARTVEVWDMNGKVVLQAADLPLQEEVPVTFDAVPTGPRAFEWRADASAQLVWVEARDEGDPDKDTAVRDEVLTVTEPFDLKPTTLLNLPLRYAGLTWGSGDEAFVEECWWKNRRQRTSRFAPDLSGEPAPLFDRSWEDHYSDPGVPLLRRTPAGTHVLLIENGSVFLSGAGGSPKGDFPFLDRLDLKKGTTERLWLCSAPYYERAIRLMEDQTTLMTVKESTDQTPNIHLRKLGEEESKRVTDFPHPYPQMKDIQKELVRYVREDGVQLTGTLYLPAGYAPEDGRLPTLLWAYPREFKSADAAGQVKDSPHRFPRISWSSPLPWLTRGYAILDGPTMPIVGEGEEEANDSYVEQLVGSAKAAADYLVDRGVSDRSRIAIGGHSYGAFMTANLLAHSEIFCAGVAMSGAYNRTLTPFGFQAEQRTFWQAPEVYFNMSAFAHADQIKAPILLIHGDADNNSGTYPMQSERLYNALKGLGATVRLVMLPHESHGYKARESVMHVLWEVTEWLDRYVKRDGG